MIWEWQKYENEYKYAWRHNAQKKKIRSTESTTFRRYSFHIL